MDLGKVINQEKLRSAAKTIGKHTAKGLGKVGEAAVGGAKGIAGGVKDEVAFRRKLKRKQMELEIPEKIKQKYAKKTTGEKRNDIWGVG